MAYNRRYRSQTGKYHGMSRQEKVSRITKRLEQGITDLFTSENYKKYLHTMGKFRHYSFSNTILIALQKPDATLVAGYKSWQKNFHRQVKKGEKGITIFAPIMVKDKKEQSGPEVRKDTDIDGKQEREDAGQTAVRYTTATVFDISQTEGEPLPSLGVDELYGKVPDYDRFMDAMMQVSPVPVFFDDIPSSAKGYFSPKENKICIRQGMSEMQTMKTCIHEMTHAELHDRQKLKEEGRKISRETAEVEAESVAYIVCEYFGLDTSEYSFPYIAGWSSSQEMKELKASMDRIRTTADGMIGDLCRVMYPEHSREHAEKENYLRTAEDMLEQNDNSLDGIINNLPTQDNSDCIVDTAEKQTYDIHEELMNARKTSEKINSGNREEKQKEELSIE